MTSISSYPHSDVLSGTMPTNMKPGRRQSWNRIPVIYSLVLVLLHDASAHSIDSLPQAKLKTYLCDNNVCEQNTIEGTLTQPPYAAVGGQSRSRTFPTLRPAKQYCPPHTLASNLLRPTQDAIAHCLESRTRNLCEPLANANGHHSSRCLYSLLPYPKLIILFMWEL